MKILLCDDEATTRENIARMLSCIPYVDLIEKACDGEEAAEILSRTAFDIVVTDICMPKMSGLELLQYIREHNIDAATIIMSGYSDFEYAKKAIRYGAADYILKPIDSSTLINLIETTAKALENQRYQRDNARNTFFNRILGHHRVEPAKAREEMSALNLPSDTRSFILGILNCTEMSASDNSRIYSEIHRFLKPTRKEDISGYVCRLQSSEMNLVFLNTHQTETTFMERARELTAQILTEICGELEVSCILSEPVTSMENLPTTEDLIRYGSYIQLDEKETLTVFRKDLDSDMKSIKEEIASLMDAMKESLEWSEKERRDYITDLLQSIGRLTTVSIDEGKLQMAALKLAIADLIAEEHYDDDSEIENEMNILKMTIHFEAMRSSLCSILDKIAELNNYSSRSLSEVIRDTIRRNVMDNMSNNTFSVADSLKGLSYSDTYIKYIFSSTYGCSVKEYITELKMEKAKELLKQDLQIKEIAALTGYDNQRYFARCFKEYTNKTPTEWRESEPD